MKIFNLLLGLLVINIYGVQAEQNGIAGKCFSVLSSLPSLCGVKIKNLEKVNEACFIKNEGISLIFRNGSSFEKIAMFDFFGIMLGDGGSRVLNGMVVGGETYIILPNGKVIETDYETCPFYLGRDYSSYWEQKPSELKFHLCEGIGDHRDFRSKHPNVDCR